MADESPNHQQPLDAAEALPAGVDVSGLMHLGLDSDSVSPFGADTGHGPGFQFVPPAPEVLAEHFPELEILECIGRGGMGCVYKARQRHLDRLVALKILPTELGRDTAFQERFTREARAMAKLTHPHIVTLHDFGFAGGMYYLVMEYMDGMNLRELLQAERPVGAETLAIVAQLADALQSAHEQGLIHRDIKPENILFDRRGHVKIADFGLVKLAVTAPLATSLTRTRETMGTPHYMPPEQWENPQSVDHRADIYSLGVILYEMLTGRIPIGRFDLPSEKTDVDARVDRICIRSMQRDPEKRYQQAGDMQQALQAADAPAAPAAPAFLTEWIERVRVPGLLAQLLGFLAGILHLIGGFFRGIGRFIKSQWEAFPLMTVIGCAVIVFACIFDWAIGTRRNERNGVVYMQQYGISAFDSATIVNGVLLENYWVVVAAAAITLIALAKRRHRLRSELLIALLSVYGMVHVILVYGYYEQKVFERLNYFRDTDFMRVELTINPFFVGMLFGLFFLGALWNIAAMVYRSMDDNDRGVRSICRSLYRVMMGDPTTYI